MRLDRGALAGRRSRGGLTLLGVAAFVGMIAACGSDTTVTGTQGTAAQVGLPASWSLSTFSTTSFETGVEGISTHAGKLAGYLHGTTVDATGGMEQRIDAAPFRGQRVKASAWVNESFMTDAGAFGIAMDAPANQTRSSVTIPAPVGGSDAWHQVFVVFDVPSNAVGLDVATSLNGSGQLFFDDIALAVVDTTTPLTASIKVSAPKDSLALVAVYAGAHATLLNADFESGLTGH